MRMCWRSVARVYATFGWVSRALLLAACVAAIPPARAGDVQPGAALMRPRAVVLHVHAGIADQRFVPILGQQLQKGLAVPVHTLATDFDLTSLRPAIGKIDAAQLVESVIRNVDWTRHAQTVQVLVIGDDMRLPPANYNFAVSNGTPATPHHVVVVSLARLQEHEIIGGADAHPDRTAERAAKMILKNVARVSGYAHSDRCVFAFPRNIDELDAIPAGYCEPDLAALIAAGIARPLMPR